MPISSEWMPWLVGLGLNSLLAAIAWVLPKKLLTPAGIFHAWALGVILFGTLGWRGYVVMVVYFLVGSAVTRIGKQRKEEAGIAEKRSGARGPENVWGSALTATLCALSIYALGSAGTATTKVIIVLLALGYVASIATKLADTTATEIGKAYGRRTFLITNFQPVPAGTEGAVSLEGTLAGLLGAALIATLGWAVRLIAPIEIPMCIAAAFIATNLESLIGATLQSKYRWLTNEMVNIVNTFLGAIAAVAIAGAYYFLAHQLA